MRTPDKRLPRRQAGRAVLIVAREAAQFIAREASKDSLITVIRAESVAHGERMRVFVSVFPIEKARAALAFLEAARGILRLFKTARAFTPPTR